MKTITSSLFPLAAVCVAIPAFAQTTGSTATPVEGLDEKRTKRGALEEVIVTAQKRKEQLQEVPIPVTAISANALVDGNQLRLEDYYARVPGVTYSLGPYGEPFVVMRGLTSNPYTNPTVGISVDDVPYGASTQLGGGYTVPDIDPSELMRVEVLRGPQGTLYGASSLGGLIKYVTLDPTTDRLSGRVQAGTSSIYNGDRIAYSARGAVNVPLGMRFALRASGWTREDPGYVDQLVSGENAVNKGTTNGGRLSTLWRPSETFSLKLSALVQDSAIDGSSAVDYPSGRLVQSAIPGTGKYGRDSEVYSANMTANFGTISLVSVTGYSQDSFHGLLQFGTASTIDNNTKTDKFTQEVRLSGELGSKLDWLLGGFYADENSPARQDILGADPVSGELIGLILSIPYKTTYSEYAAFANLTFHVTDRFDVQLGGRQSHNSQEFTQSLIFPDGAETVVPKTHSSADPFTYLVTPRFRFSQDLMMYARLASGYRVGGPNPNTNLPGIPNQFKPDRTENYEIGIKGDVLGHALSFDASLYYIAWKDMQLLLRQSGFSYTVNAGQAKSQGLEVSMQARPSSGMTIAASLAWNEAVLTQDFPVTSSVVGKSGDSLPFSSPFSGSFSIDQEFRLTNSMLGFVGAGLSYVGERGSGIGSTGPTNYPSYSKVDLRAGATLGVWTVNLFANNVTDKRGVLAGELVGTVPTVYYIQPRTIGLSLAREFGK